MCINLIRRTLIVVLLLLPGVQLRADEITPDRTASPYFAVQGEPGVDQFPLKDTQVQVRLNGVIASVHLRQVYRNQGRKVINARYVFPGSTRAAVGGMTMSIGERRLVAKIKEKEAAAKIFAAAQAAGKSAALLGQRRPNVFSMDVANILPGDVVTIELDYTEILSAESGEYEFVYPGVVGPRYSSDAAGKPADTAWAANPQLRAGLAGASNFNIEVDMVSPVPVAALQSTTHTLLPNWRNTKTVSLKLAEPGAAAAQRDFILRYRLQGDALLTGLTRFKLAGENYFMLLAQPPRHISPTTIPARDYLFIVDVSGSMHGFPLDTARTLVSRLLQDLGTTDSFNILFFSGGSSMLAPTPLPATAENKASALVMLQNFSGGGGTELLPALKTALAMPRGEQQSRSIVVITDGFITAEAEAFKLIDSALGDSNLFAFGIGSSVNRYLIEGLAKVGRAEPFIVTDQSSAAAEAERFRRYIAAPVLTRIQLQGNDVELHDLEPQSQPDLLAERPLLIMGKYREARPNAHLTLSGIAGDGAHRWQFDLASAAEDPGLPKLWARKRLERLYVFPGAAQEARAEILSLGLKYSLLTSATSFVSVDETVRNKDLPATHVTQPLPLPTGVSNNAVGGSLQPMPEPETLWMFCYAALLLAARALWSHRLPVSRA